MPINVQNRLDVSEAVNREFPGLIVNDPGGFCDQVAHRLNRIDGFAGADIRWGRKARRADGTHPNLDVVTFRLDPADPSRKKLVDVIANSESPQAHPAWQLRPEHEEAGNGFWCPPVAPDRDAPTGPPVSEPERPPDIGLDLGPVLQAIDAIHVQIGHIARRLETLSTDIVGAKAAAEAARLAAEQAARLEPLMRAVRPVTLSASLLGTVKGTVGAPQT